jgi:hypothetical protein
LKNRTFALGALVLLLGSVTAFSLHAQTKPKPGGAGAASDTKEHTAIEAAISNLTSAAKALQSADRDFQGHRDKAAQLTQDAIKQCKLSLAAAIKK